MPSVSRRLLVGVLASATAVAGVAMARPGTASMGPAARASGRPEAWVVGQMSRLRPTAAPGTTRTARLEGARGEAVPFQLGVAATHGPLTGVELRLSPLRGPGGSVIPRRRLVRYREHFTRITHHSPGYGGPVLRRSVFPDALVPFVDPATHRPPRAGAAFAPSGFSLRPGRTQPLWVDVVVPRGATAGVYHGRWRVTSDQGDATGRIRLRVRDFALPRRPTELSSFGLYHHRTRANERLLLRYGVQPDPVDPGDERALVRHGLATNELGFWSGASIDHCTMRRPPSLAVLRRAVARHLPGLPLYNYTADEISRCHGLYRRIRTWARRLHAVGVDQLLTMVPVPQLLDDGTGRTAVDDFVLLPVQLKRVDPQLAAQVTAAGGRFWSYQALVQGGDTPSWELDVPGGNYRVLPGFLNARTGLTGVLYWTVDYWQHDPWRDIDYHQPGDDHYPGEGTLVYPGRRVGVRGDVPSIRLAWIRQGIADYEYVRLLTGLGHGDLAQEIIEPAAHSWTQWTADATVLARVHHRLAVAIERAAH